jgi:hypothetical protein
MLTLVQPAPSTHCTVCNGELRLKLIKPVEPALDSDVEIFVCAKCSHEQSYLVSHNPYSPDRSCHE